MSIMSNVDWDFIRELEGYKLQGYVPEDDAGQPHDNSGVTIVSGLDLSEKNDSYFEGLPESIIAKLRPFYGLKGAQANAVAGNLKLEDSEGTTLYEHTKKKELELLKTRWQEKTGTSFDDLPKNQATPIASVAFQYGDLESQTPNFWRQVTTGDWEGAEANLANFEDSWPTRRKKELAYLKKKTEPVVKPVDVQAEIQPFLEEQRRQAQVVPPMEQVAAQPIPEEEAVAPVIDAVPEEEAVPPVMDNIPEEESVFPSGQQLEPMEEVAIESKSNLYIDRMSRATEARKPLFTQEELQQYRKQDPAKLINTLLEKDVESAGPVSEFIKNEQFGLAGPMLFMENNSVVWKAAFETLNPVIAFRDIVNDALHAVDDENGYDYSTDPQLKPYEDSRWRFYDSKSSVETAKRLARLKDEWENQDVLNSSASLGVQLVAGSATPSSFVPVAPLKAMQNVSKVARFASGAAFTGGVVGTEQAFLQAARETRDFGDTIKMTALGSFIGGSVNSVFGRRMAQGKIDRMIARERKAEEAFGDGGFYRDAGSGVNPEIARRQMYETIEQEAAKETGIGAEKVPFNPVLRMLQSRNPLVRGITAKIVDMGGVMQKKVDDEVAMSQSVERAFTAKYIAPLLESVREIDVQYLAYRGVVAKEGDIARSFQVAGQQIKDKFNRSLNAMSMGEFRVRIGKAMRRGDADPINDAATPYVNNIARRSREHLNFLKNEAESVRMFETQARKALSAARAAGASPQRIAELESRLQRIRSEGVFLNNAISYLPRVYRVDKIMANVNGFKSIVRNHGANALGLRGQALDDYVENIFDSVTKSKPYMAVDEGVENLEDVITAGSVKSRELDISDELLEEFLENDIEVLLRHNTKQMGTDIELTRVFGSVDMKAQIDEITTEWRRLIDRTTDPVKKAEFEKEMVRDLKDIRGLRDRVRGTYGASKDPHAMSSRFVRSMKSFNVIVGMGGATVSSIPDIVRTAMVEGMNTTFEKGLRNAFRENARLLKKLSLKEMRAAGVAADATLGLRASAFADVGDVFGNRLGMEGFLNQSASAMFLLNGLNAWNQILKEFAGGVTMLRMTEHIMKPWNSLSKSSKQKFLKNGIDQQMHSRMQQQIRNNGEQVDGEWMPNTELWSDTTARTTFRIALGQNVDRIIITPGAGDRALWTSTEFGSLLTQFKSYGQSAVMRMLVSGMQERDGAFWIGGVALVAMAGLVNEIKRAQYGIDKKESWNEKLINAVDRSGITGSFIDMNNALEKVTNNSMGLRAMFTNQPQYQLPFGAKAGALGGPAASNVVNFAGIVSDVLGGNVDQKTLDSLGFITPYRNLPYADPLFDRLYNQ